MSKYCAKKRHSSIKKKQLRKEKLRKLRTALASGKDAQYRKTILDKLAKIAPQLNF
jgi:hypothetical protein